MQRVALKSYSCNQQYIHQTHPRQTFLNLLMWPLAVPNTSFVEHDQQLHYSNPTFLARRLSRGFVILSESNSATYYTQCGRCLIVTPSPSNYQATTTHQRLKCCSKHTTIYYITSPLIHASRVKLDDLDSYLSTESPASHDADDDDTSYFVTNISPGRLPSCGLFTSTNCTICCTDRSSVTCSPKN